VVEVHDGWAGDSPVVTKRILVSGFGLTLAVVLTAVVVVGRDGEFPSPARSPIVKSRFPVGTAHSVPIGGLGVSDGRIRIDGVHKDATAIIAAGGPSILITLPDRGMFVSRRCGGWYSAK
jgi:hypothetical protein